VLLHVIVCAVEVHSVVEVYLVSKDEYKVIWRGRIAAAHGRFSPYVRFSSYSPGGAVLHHI